MEGTLSYSARHKRLGQDRRAGKHSHATRRHFWTPYRKNRAGPAEVPAGRGAGSRVSGSSHRGSV